MFSDARSGFYNLSLANYGHEDIGAAQGSGTVSSAANYDGLINGKARTGLTELTLSATGYQEGQSIVVAGTTDYDGVHTIIRKTGASTVVIDVAFNVTRTGTYNFLGAEGAFAGFIPMVTITAGQITTLTFHRPKMQIGDPKPLAYQAGVFYPFAGIIKEIQISAGDIRLLRYPTNNPEGLDELA